MADAVKDQWEKPSNSDGKSRRKGKQQKPSKNNGKSRQEQWKKAVKWKRKKKSMATAEAVKGNGRSRKRIMAKIRQHDNGQAVS